MSNLNDLCDENAEETQVYIVGMQYKPEEQYFENGFVGNMAMTKDHATMKPVITRSNTFIARPMNQLRSVLAKEIIHTRTLTSNNKSI